MAADKNKNKGIKDLYISYGINCAIVPNFRMVLNLWISFCFWRECISPNWTHIEVSEKSDFFWSRQVALLYALSHAFMNINLDTTLCVKVSGKWHTDPN